MTMVLKSYTYNCGNDEGIGVRDRGAGATAHTLLPVFSRADSTRQFTRPACLGICSNESKLASSAMSRN
jgi:hypothetical protein